MQKRICLGPAGSGGSGEEGFKKIKQLGLDAVEIEFTYNVWMKPSDAKKIKELNKKLGLKLSIHAPYFINLNSKEREKIEASKKRILKCGEIGHLVGAKYIVFHAGFYSGKSEEETFEIIKAQILDLQKQIKQKHWNVVLAPETMGKPSQFGTIDELIKLKRETNCHLCIDFSHVIARENLSYEEIIKKVKPIKDLHFHMTGVDLSKTTLPHQTTPEKDIKELLQALKKHKINCTIINESPSPLRDTIKTKEILEKL